MLSLAPVVKPEQHTPVLHFRKGSFPISSLIMICTFLNIELSGIFKHQVCFYKRHQMIRFNTRIDEIRKVQVSVKFELFNSMFLYLIKLFWVLPKSVKKTDNFK